MKISKKTFGILSNGKKVRLYTLKAGDLRLSIITLGATWTSLMVPSHSGKKDDILLGLPSFDAYCRNGSLGITVGRFANRIGGSVFTLNNRRYTLEKNNGENSLHGGTRAAFSRRLWKAEAYEEKEGVFVRFELESPDGDGGYPGRLKAAVSYGLTKSNELIANYEAKVDAPCPVNFTNHAYFNLAGESSGNILAHELSLNSSFYLEVDETLIPTGKLVPVEGGPFDFRGSKPIGRDIEAAVKAGAPGGYDHCFVVDGEPGKMRPCAEVHEGSSGRTMRVLTTQPGVQLYTGNFLKGEEGKIGSVYKKHAGFCLETQHYPDAPNKPSFPSAIFGPGRNYHEKAVFAFDW
jgi:aldose 1-epimerase